MYCPLNKRNAPCVSFDLTHRVSYHMTTPSDGLLAHRNINVFHFDFGPLSKHKYGTIYIQYKISVLYMMDLYWTNYMLFYEGIPSFQRINYAHTLIHLMQYGILLSYILHMSCDLRVVFTDAILQ